MLSLICFTLMSNISNNIINIYIYIPTPASSFIRMAKIILLLWRIKSRSLENEDLASTCIAPKHGTDTDGQTNI